ncbi:MAG: c-type cytochrome [Gammaproteobacteria bacterium]|nr:c-type cytochrome [Gammaproteobacteria bacterium]
MKTPGLCLILMLLCILPGAGWTLPWSEDMRDQPSVKPQESQVFTSPSSMPTTGTDLFPPPQDISELVKARLEAGTLVNPVPRTGESINRGKVIYDTHCIVCHGEQGYGDGPVGKKYIPDPMNLTIDYVQIQPDGQLFYTISHGSIAMPFYRDAIPVEDRWHLINYIKAVFGQKLK